MGKVISGAENPVFELRSLDASAPPPARVIENPWWDEVDGAIKRCYKNDGFLTLQIILPKGGYIQELSMNCISGEFRLIAKTNDDDPRMQLLEWWDPSLIKYTGKAVFDEDEWDSRTISKDLAAAERLFLDFYKNGDLCFDSLKDMRSQWDRKPME
ncbi:hypothetical protein FHR56_003610 [Xanthomonas sacchari]|uniref:DUF6911 family protein n=1 Tax=unclassified Xanthomonas TaxID=2643310 RepID=UPI001368D047|nr:MULTISPECIES: hypothetical protein [unclassified Xanthomonas]MBB6368431.1 hypothetical protein [Xanthomonas sp. F10]